MAAPAALDAPIDLRARRCARDGLARQWCAGVDGDGLLWPPGGPPQRLTVGALRDVAADSAGAWLLTDRAVLRWTDPQAVPEITAAPAPDPRALTLDDAGGLWVLSADTLTGPDGAAQPLPTGFDPRWGGLVWARGRPWVVGAGGALTWRAGGWVPVPGVQAPATAIAADATRVRIGDATGLWIDGGGAPTRLGRSAGIPGPGVAQIVLDGQGGAWLRAAWGVAYHPPD